MRQLTLRLLGAFQAWCDNQPLVDFRSSRIQNLLAYLVLEAKQPHTRAALAALFWPEEPEGAAKQNLRQALYQLRQILGESSAQPTIPFLLVTRDTVQFNPASSYTLDVAVLQAHLAQQQLADAVALYQGDLLAGVNSDSPLFEEWLLLQREGLHMQVLEALAHLTQQALAQGDYGQMQHYSRRQLALEPWREAAHRQLILALVYSGDRNAALTQYESCRRVLATELQVEPDAETQALVEQIRKDEVRITNHELRVTPPLPSTTPHPNTAQSTAQEPAIVNPTSKIVNQIDWGEAPDIGTFHGREEELATLQRWVSEERCRLVTILGMGGMGKTTLAAHFVRNVTVNSTATSTPFAFVIWRSLLNAPPLAEILSTWLQMFSDQPRPESITLDMQLAQLFDYLRQYRCLLVLDNVESIMQGADQAGRAGYYLPGYEAYGQLFKRLGETTHQSCLLITSRELPHEIAALERATAWVRSLLLGGLTQRAGQAILQTQGISSKETATAELLQRYSGNPLALMLVAETIQEFFGGDIGAFLSEEALIFDDVRDILVQQFARLSPLEQAILRWLAIEREPLTVQQLSANFPQPVPKRELLEALNSLRRRSLLEKSQINGQTASSHTTETGFALQNVITEFITNTLVDQVIREIEQVRPLLLKQHALLKAQTKEYIRQTQRRLLLQPIAARLQANLGWAGLMSQVNKVLNALRQQPDRQPTYAGGNLINLLLHVDADVGAVDFSELAIWQADLQSANLPAVNFANCEFKGCLFTDTFDAIASLTFSPDVPPLPLRLVAGTATGAIRLWQVSDGQTLAAGHEHTNFVFSVVFSPDGKLLASGSDDQSICLWQVNESSTAVDQSLRLRETLHEHSGGVWRLSLSPDGRWLASASGDCTVRLWAIEPATQAVRLQHLLIGHKRGVRSVAFSPDSRWIASGDDGGVIRLWEVASGSLIAAYKAHTRDAWSLAFSPDGQWLASGGYDRLVGLWPLAAVRAQGMADLSSVSAIGRMLAGHTGNVTGVAFSPNGQTLASSSGDQTIRLWQVTDGRTQYILQGHTDRVDTLAFSPQGDLLASGGGDQTVRLWEVSSGQALRTLQGHAQGVLDIALSPDGNLIAGAYQDRKVRLWNRHSQTIEHILTMHTNEVYAVAFSPDGTLLASGSGDQTVQVWDVQRRQPRWVLRGHNGLVRTLAVRGDGQWLASGSNDHSVRLWDLTSGEAGQVLQNQQSVWAVAFSPDGQTLACGGARNLIRLWHVDSGESFLTLHGHNGWVTSLAFSPDGTLLASGSGDQTVHLWDAHTGEQLQVLRGHAAWVYGLAFSPDGIWLATNSADTNVLLWEVASGQRRSTLSGHSNAVRAVAFETTETSLIEPSILPRLISGSIDGTIRLWNPQTGDCHALRAPRPYEGMNITGANGLAAAQRSALKALGAVEGE